MEATPHPRSDSGSEPQSLWTLLYPLQDNDLRVWRWVDIDVTAAWMSSAQIAPRFHVTLGC